REDLAEMIIAVDPDFGGVGLAIEQTFFAGENLLLGPENFLGFAPKIFGDVGQFLFQEIEVAAKKRAHALINRTLGHGAERLGRENGIVVDRCECEMQFAGALREQLGFFGVNTANQFLNQRTSGRSFILQFGLAGKDALV